MLHNKRFFLAQMKKVVLAVIVVFLFDLMKKSQKNNIYLKEKCLTVTFDQVQDLKTS